MEADMKRIIFPISILAMSGLALAHPHETKTPADAPKVERDWPYFGKKAENENKLAISDSLTVSEFAKRLETRIEKHSSKIERSLEKAEVKSDILKNGRDIKSADDIREAARAIEDLISETGVISSFADMLLDIAEDFDVETSENGLALKFDGDPIGRISVKSGKDSEHSLDLEGFGRNMTIEKDVIKRNGKTKTRIVIEVDGDEEFEIDIKPKN
jgi:hypothetical protein